MRRFVLSGFAVAALACGAFAYAVGATSTPDESRDQVRRFVLRYVEAQNTSATATTVSMWSDRPGVSSAAQGERTRGFESIRTAIEQRRQSPQVAELALGNIEIELVGDGAALAVAPFKTAARGAEPIEGVLTLVLERTGGKWKLVHEHASVKAYMVGG